MSLATRGRAEPNPVELVATALAFAEAEGATADHPALIAEEGEGYPAGICMRCIVPLEKIVAELALEGPLSTGTQY